ncbi:hypothetical protein niasHS_007738 [Heterodera schachtii]|uniref:Dynein light chain n=2 Tax=Heterodera TaxID=34509 RepID=A0ABD2LTH6_9BILA
MEKIEVKETDMKPNLIDQTIDIDIASFVKDTMEQRFAGTWHCVVGRSFGSRVSYELESFALFKVNQHTVLIFKCG